MRTRLVTNSVCGRVFLAVIIIACLVIWGCFFWFLVIVKVKGVSFFYCRLYFLVDALFLCFGLVVG